MNSVSWHKLMVLLREMTLLPSPPSILPCVCKYFCSCADNVCMGKLKRPGAETQASIHTADCGIAYGTALRLSAPFPAMLWAAQAGNCFQFGCSPVGGDKRV